MKKKSCERENIKERRESKRRERGERREVMKEEKSK
jgi:hypothetical protein